MLRQGQNTGVTEARVGSVMERQSGKISRPKEEERKSEVCI